MAGLIGLTGKSGVGKTQAFQMLIEAAQNASLSVFGFYCPAIFTEKEKTGMQVCLLPSGKIHVLGTLEKRKDWLQVGRWYMDPSVFALVKDHLKQFMSCDLLLIDEIGPAEIEGKQGWPDALELLKEDRFKLGVVSFRPAFIEFFKENYPGIKVVNLDEGEQSALTDLMERFCNPNALD